MSKRSCFLSMLSGAICFLNIFVYALLYRKSGNEDLGWMLWSFSHYFTFSIALCSFVKTTKSLIKQTKAVSVFGLILLIIGFFFWVLYIGSRRRRYKILYILYN